VGFLTPDYRARPLVLLCHEPAHGTFAAGSVAAANFPLVV